jgi:hypothetical protein
MEGDRSGTSCFSSQYSVAYSSLHSTKASPIKIINFPSVTNIISAVASSNFSVSSTICFKSARSSMRRLFKHPNSLIFSWSAQRTSCSSSLVALPVLISTLSVDHSRDVYIATLSLEMVALADGTLEMTRLATRDDDHSFAFSQ